MKSGKTIAVMASLVVMLMVTATVQASLVVDLKTSTGATSVTVTPAMIGTDITLYVWANVTGSNGSNDEKLGYLNYSVKSSATGGGALSGGGGGVTAAALNAPFADTGSQVGKMQDLVTIDGVTDLGSNNTSSGADFAKPRASSAIPAGGATGEAVNSNTWRWNVETATFRIGNAILGSGTTTLSVIIPSWSTGVVKGANWFEDGIGTLRTPSNGTYAAGTSVAFTLEATQATANAGGTYAVHYGIDGSQSNPLNGSGAVTKGFGTVFEKKWDLDGDGTFETTQLNGSIDVTYNQLKALGYQYDTAKAATFQYKTNDGVIATDVAMVTIMPDTVVAADAGGPYTVDKGTDGELVFQLHGSGMVTSGDGVILSKMWDLDGNGLFETTQNGDFLNVTYNMLKAMGYVDNVAKEATFRAATDTNRLATGSGSITLLPEPATMALLGLGGLALAIRRRRAA